MAQQLSSVPTRIGVLQEVDLDTSNETEYLANDIANLEERLAYVRGLACIIAARLGNHCQQQRDLADFAVDVYVDQQLAGNQPGKRNVVGWLETVMRNGLASRRLYRGVPTLLGGDSLEYFDDDVKCASSRASFSSELDYEALWDLLDRLADDCLTARQRRAYTALRSRVESNRALARAIGEDPSGSRRVLLSVGRKLVKQLKKLGFDPLVHSARELLGCQVS